eukprot:SAG31_NODE_2110_length_6426_cov_6.371898_5_plen_88_part_00
MTGEDGEGNDVTSTPWFDNVDCYIETQAAAAAGAMAFPRGPASTLIIAARYYALETITRERLTPTEMLSLNDNRPDASEMPDTWWCP